MDSVKWCGNNICRTCLSETSQMKSIFEKMDGDKRTLYEVLGFIGNINVIVADKLPKQVCNDCEVMISRADAFKRQCIESEKILNDILYQGLNDIKTFEKSPIKDEIIITVAMPLYQPYQCSVCMEKFADLSVLENHVTSHSQNCDSKETPGYTDLINSDIKTDTSNKSTYDCDNVKEEKIESDTNEGFDDNETPLESISDEIIDEKLLLCSCGQKFLNKQDYMSHLNDCQAQKQLEKKVEKLINEENSGLPKQYPCEICNVILETGRQRRIHMRIHKKSIADGEYQCSMCMRKFTRLSSYTAHLRRHEALTDRKYVCTTCKREFQHQAHLDNHISRAHSKEKGYTCDKCDKSFISEENLLVHKERHKTDKKHRCKLCNKAFNMPSSLIEHMRTHTGEKPFLCSFCGRGFSQKTNLVQHMRRHQGLKTFKCDHCDRSFVSKGELIAHNRTHSGAHPFVCDECGNGFTTSSSLRKHRRIHTGERPYACDLCDMRFAASGTLKNHRRRHTGEKPFHCSYCDKAFVQRQDLVSHIRCHTGERPYVCSVCGQSFRKASAMKAHVKIHGKDLQGSIAQICYKV